MTTGTLTATSERSGVRTTAVRLACGAALGAAIALVVAASTTAALLLVVGAAALTWALRGFPRLAAAVAVSLAATALLVVAVSLLPSRPAIPAALVGGLWLLGVAAAAVLSRLRPGWASHEGSTAVDVLVAVSALGWAAWFAGRVPAGDRDAVLLLVGSDDNAAWVDAVARGLLPGTPTVAPETVAAYGPVVGTVLGTVATAGGGPAVTVVRTYGLLVVAALLAAGLLVRRVRGADATARSCVAWVAAAVVVVAGDLYLGTRFGFLTAVLLVVLVLVAAALVAATDTRPRGATGLLARLAAATVVWAAASSWVGAVPAGAVALTLLGLGIARGARGGRPTAWTAGALAVVILLGAALALHWARVAPTGGGPSGLISAGGDVPTATALALVLAVAAVAAAWAVDRRGPRPGGLAHSALLVGGYAVAVVAASWIRTGGAAYAAQKTLFLAILLCSVIGLAAVAQAPRPEGRPLTTTVVASAAVVSVTALAGPTVVTAAATAWPRPVPAPGWLDTGLAAVRPGQSIGCLPDPSAAPDGRGSTLDAYWCTRWLSSLAAADGAAPLRWRAWLIGAATTEVIIADLGAQGPTTVVVLGPGGLERLGPDVERLLAERGVALVRL